MIAAVVKMTVKPGKEAEFEKVFSALVEQVQENEPGTLLYRLCRLKDSRTYTVLETYRDQKASDAHVEAEHLKVATEALMPLLAESPAPEITNYEVVAG